MKNFKERRSHAKQYIDKKLLMRTRIFCVMVVVMLGVVIVSMVETHINTWLAFVGIAGGFIIGLIAGRMFDIRWHPEASQVVGRLDRLGLVILILYIVFSISRNWIFGHWIHGPTLTSFTLAFVLGAILGRVTTTIKNIKKVLSEKAPISLENQ